MRASVGSLEIETGLDDMQEAAQIPTGQYDEMTYTLGARTTARSPLSAGIK